MSEPLVLGFDTSAAHCAAALLRGSDVLVSRTEAMARGQAERLMVLLEEVLGQAKASWGDLDAIGVGVGPGNFTGIRISVSAARGLALALNIPAVGVSAFQALALGQDGMVFAAVKGPADRTYVQSLDGQFEGPPLICGPDDLPDYPSMLDPRLIGFPSVQALSLRAPLLEAQARYPLAEAIARIAAARRTTATTPPAPLYLKPADAAPARDTAPVILDDT